MESRGTGFNVGVFILIAFVLAELIAFIGSMISYYGILHGIETNPMNPQNFLDLGKWIVDFLIGQLYGWPISLIITSIAYFLMGGRSPGI
jgi:hypothetical protein